MGEIKVSVVIPVYNTEEYVKEALYSIMNQTLADIEIIVINDGSTDNSLNIIHSLCAKDDRIKIYDQENKGLSETRNRGIRAAKGEFIYFMDSDDTLHKDALFQCYKKCKLLNLDFVFFDAEVFFETEVFPINMQYVDYQRAHLIDDSVYSGIDVLERLFSSNGYYASACLSFINLSYLRRIDLDFHSKIVHEDELFTFLLYIHAERVGHIDKSFFKRRIRSNSIITVNFSRENATGYFIVAQNLVKLKNKMNDKKISFLVDKRLSVILNGVLYNSRSMPLKDRYFTLLTSIRNFKRYLIFKNVVTAAVPTLRYLKIKFR